MTNHRNSSLGSRRTFVGPGKTPTTQSSLLRTLGSGACKRTLGASDAEKQNELQAKSHRGASGSAPPSPHWTLPEGFVSEATDFRVADIKAERSSKGVAQFRVQWLGPDDLPIPDEAFCTWEPLDNIAGSEHLVRALRFKTEEEQKAAAEREIQQRQAKSDKLALLRDERRGLGGGRGQGSGTRSRPRELVAPNEPSSEQGPSGAASDGEQDGSGESDVGDDEIDNILDDVDSDGCVQLIQTDHTLLFALACISLPKFPLN